MILRRIVFAAAAVLISSALFAQGRGPQAPLAPGASEDPFPNPIPAAEGVITVNVREFATLPDIANIPARMMLLINEPGTKHLFVNDMRGPIYRVSYDGKIVETYVDVNDPKWGFGVQSMGRERGVQSFAFHPQFGQSGTPGFGRFYVYTDTPSQTPAPPADFTSPNAATTHDTVLLEFSAKTPNAPAYDGGAPRELFRLRQPFANHNAGHATFNPTAAPGSPEFGLLYVGIADGGSGGDPMNQAQNLGSAFGKIIRINPTGTSPGKKYGIPASNPFVSTPGALPEIYAYGVRNPQRLAWDSKDGSMFMSDIGQNTIEKVSRVTAGANLGWNVWEGSYRFLSRGVSTENPRSDPKITYPVVEWGQPDPLLLSNSASVGVIAYRGNQVPKLSNLLLFADMPVGEMFYVSADTLPNGGQDAIRRILFSQNGAPAKRLLDLVIEKNTAQGKPPANRSDLRFGQGPDNQIFLLNKGDGTIRLIVP